MYFDSCILHLMRASKEINSKSICFVCYVTIRNMSLSTTRVLTSIILAQMNLSKQQLRVQLLSSDTTDYELLVDLGYNYTSHSTFQLTITVILCPSNTVKSFCNA